MQGNFSFLMFSSYHITVHYSPLSISAKSCKISPLKLYWEVFHALLPSHLRRRRLLQHHTFSKYTWKFQDLYNSQPWVFNHIISHGVCLTILPVKPDSFKINFVNSAHHITDSKEYSCVVSRLKIICFNPTSIFLL